MASLSPQTATGVALFVLVTVLATFVVLAIGIARVRHWNPSREVRFKV